MTTVVSILMSDIIPLKDRGVWQGLINIIFASGAGSGAPLGGILSDSVGWRWAFLGQVPLCILAFIAVVFALKLPAREQKDWRTNLRRVDFLGAIVLVAAVFCLIFGLDRGSNVSWSIPMTYGPLIASLFLFPLFGLIEIKIAAEPFAPGHILFDRTLFACYMCNFFAVGGWLALLYYLPLFFQAVDGLSATQAAVRLLPGIIAGVSGSLFGGFVMKKTGKYFWLTVTAYLMLLTGTIPILLFAGLVTNNTYGLAVGLVLCAFGNGIGVTSSLIALSRCSHSIFDRADIRSLECCARRSSHHDCGLVHVPSAWLSDWNISLCNSHSAVFTSILERLTGEWQRSRQDCPRSTPKPRRYQDTRSEGRKNGSRELW